MDSKRLLTGTLVGVVVMSVMGFLLYEVLFASFMEAQMAITPLETPIWWAAILSAVAHGLLITLAIGWTGDASAVGGLKTGAIIGFLVWFGADMILYAILGSGFATLAGGLADSVLATVQYGVVGAAIGAVLGRGAQQEMPAAT